MKTRSVPSKNKIQEAIEVHDELNPKLWNNDGTIKPDVYDKLSKIADEFLEYIDIPLNIVDIEIVGSNASYNYNENSDIDLHIIVNSDVNYVDFDILRTLYNSKKNSFNDNYDLDIDGIPIELYIEDVRDGNATNGRYSIKDNSWVVFPEPIEYDIPDISDTLAEYENKCNMAIESTNPQDILDLINDIYMMRKLGLAEDGEASVGNLVFKELRNEDMIPKLKDRYYELRSKELTESKDMRNALTDSEKLKYYYGTVRGAIPYGIYKIDNKFYDGNGIEISKQEVNTLDLFKTENSKQELDEASLSRLFQHTKNKDTFAVIGSQDKDTKKSRFQELKSLVAKLRNKISNLGFNYLEGTYTYDDGEQGVEDSLIVYNIPKDDALDIANKINQESIIWKDDNYFGFLDANGNEEGTFDKGNLTFDQQITNMYGSKLRTGNGLKPAFAFECKLIETDNKGGNFSKQHNANIIKYPVCNIRLDEELGKDEENKFSKLLGMLKKEKLLTAIDKVDITNYIMENDILTLNAPLTEKQQKAGYMKAYNVYVNSEFVGVITYKDGEWLGMKLTKVKDLK